MPIVLDLEHHKKTSESSCLLIFWSTLLSLSTDIFLEKYVKSPFLRNIPKYVLNPFRERLSSLSQGPTDKKEGEERKGEEFESCKDCVFQLSTTNSVAALLTYVRELTIAMTKSLK